MSFWIPLSMGIRAAKADAQIDRSPPFVRFRQMRLPTTSGTSAECEKKGRSDPHGRSDWPNERIGSVKAV